MTKTKDCRDIDSPFKIYNNFLTLQSTDPDDVTPVRSHRTVAILDADKSPLDNFQTIRTYIASMALSDKIEMLLTLAAFCRAELQG